MEVSPWHVEGPGRGCRGSPCERLLLRQRVTSVWEPGTWLPPRPARQVAHVDICPHGCAVSPSSPVLTRVEGVLEEEGAADVCQAACVHSRGCGPSREGQFTVQVRAFNDVSAVSLAKQLFVVREPCQPPPREEHGAGEGAGRARPGGHRGMGNRGRRGALAPGAAAADVEGASRGFWGLVPRPREGPSWPPCACSQGLGEVACAGVSAGLSQLSLPSQGPGFELHVGLPGQWGLCLPNQSITKAWLREDVSIFRRKGCLDSRDVNTQGHGRSFPSAYQGLGSTGQLSASSVPSSLRVGADFPPWGRSAQ